jgi:glycerol uptake operon antiterminator
MHEYIDTIKDNPIIAAVHTKEGLEQAISLGVPTIFLLNTDIFSAKAFVDIARNANCNVFLHMDLIDGLSPGAKALDYVQKRIAPSGIISTKSSLIKHARERGVFCVQRFFMVDNASFDVSVKAVRKNKPSMVEIMPGIIPSVIQRFTEEVTVPVIAGGMVEDTKQVIDALSSGAIGISTGAEALWKE